LLAVRVLTVGARALTLLILITLVIIPILGASAARAGSLARVAVQPVSAAPPMVAASLRAQIVRVLRGHGYRVVTSIPSVEGTGQYLALARDHRLSAFVVCDLDDRKTRQTLTMLVWDGAQGSVLGRWSVSGPGKNLGKMLTKGFWKNLGPVLEKARAPELSMIPPAPPMRLEVN